MTYLFKICLAAIALVLVNPAIGDSIPDLSYRVPNVKQPESYGTVISTKLGSGFSNLLLSPLEIPKNIINTTNDTNVALGVTGGVFKGFLHMAGRFLAGTVDTLTFAIPTEPLTTPPFVWQNFKTETSYNPLFKIKN